MTRTYIILEKSPTCLTSWKISLICEFVSRSISSIITIILLSETRKADSRVFLALSKEGLSVNLAFITSQINLIIMLIVAPSIATNAKPSITHE